MRRNHGERALDFARSQVSYFRTRPLGTNAVQAWRMVCRALGDELDDDASIEVYRESHAAGAAGMT
jgi:hypothetical protein